MGNYANKRTAEPVNAWQYRAGLEDGFAAEELVHTKAGDSMAPCRPYVYGSKGERVPVTPSDFIVLGADGNKIVLGPDVFLREFKEVSL